MDTPAPKTSTTHRPLNARGRGAVSNRSARYLKTMTETVDDGWAGSEANSGPPTTVTALSQRTIISYNASPDLSFDRTINPYKGCEHGCIYCYARPGHAYLDLSPGLDFERNLFSKPNAADLLRAQLDKPGYRPAPIVIGGDTDPYQPIERRLEITRSVLEVLAETRHPVGLVTKSALVTRDIDLLAPMAAQGLAKIAVSVTTLDRRLARAMEPRAATPAKRLAAIEALSAARIPVRVMVAPVIPGLTDHEVEAILSAAARAGAVTAGYVLLRLPLEIKDLFAEWLAVERPAAAKKVMSLVKQMRAGAFYQSAWFERGRGDGPLAALLEARVANALRRLGLDKTAAPLRRDLFRPPRRIDQADLFGPP